MILYHGSNVIVEQPKLIRQNRYLDFGFWILYHHQPRSGSELRSKGHRSPQNRSRYAEYLFRSRKQWLSRSAVCCALTAQMKRGWIL